MKKLSFYLLMFTVLMISINTKAQTHQLTKIWETDTVLRTPESVLYEAKEKILYVSNIDGVPTEKDGKGFISKLDLKGKPIQLEWVKGLNAPKGMGIYKNKLYVADLTEVVVIDLKTAAILEKIPVDGSIFLNDITIDSKGVVYVSDSRAGNVHQIENSKVNSVLRNIKSPNGLLVDGKQLLVLNNGALSWLLPNDQLALLVDGMDPSTDGIEKVKENEFIVSSWAGAIYYLNTNGSKQVLLDGRADKKNTADIGYDAKNRILYVPTFYGNKLVAYRLD